MSPAEPPPADPADEPDVASYVEEAADLLPWAPTDDDGLRYRQQLIARRLVDAELRGRQEILGRIERAITRLESDRDAYAGRADLSRQTGTDWGGFGTYAERAVRMDNFVHLMRRLLEGEL